MDDVDITVEHMEKVQSAALAEVSAAVAAIPTGKAGDCDICGDFFKRVVEVKHPTSGGKVHSCARCRDRYGI